MSKNILALLNQDSDWNDLLVEFFEDTFAKPRIANSVADFNLQFDQKPPDLVFIEDKYLTLPIKQKLKALKKSSSQFRFFVFGKEDSELDADGTFCSPESLTIFQRGLTEKLSFPDRVSVQVIDDEPEIGNAIKEYLEGCSAPSFEVRYAENGKLGLQAIKGTKPDVLILDIKMPEMTGIEVYREVCKAKMDFPVIVFFDAITGHEVTELRKYGQPVVVDKGSKESSMPEMASLIKKIIFFK